MNHKVRIIKGRDQKEPELDQPGQLSRHTTREITTTIKLWVSEFKERRRTINVSNPRSGWQHKAWGGAQRNPRRVETPNVEPAEWAAANLFITVDANE